MRFSCFGKAKKIFKERKGKREGVGYMTMMEQLQLQQMWWTLLKAELWCGVKSLYLSNFLVSFWDINPKGRGRKAYWPFGKSLLHILWSVIHDGNCTVSHGLPSTSALKPLSVSVLHTAKEGRSGRKSTWGEKKNTVHSR